MTPTESDLQLWGGMECTINRVGDAFFDQYAWSGHRQRGSSDFALLASLGITTLRTGLHWEHYEATQSWDSFDRALRSMQEHQLHPIAGLLHHGSGPLETSLLDPDFPEKLAAYALLVAQRYPWLIDYTPVNEPQTTSRFSCLYGHWYPHGRTVSSYVRGLYNQLKGVVLAMRAIRTVQPAARLIHTEDGGATTSTPQLEAFRLQREHRRWLGTDLLCGRVTRQHPLFSFLLEQGLLEEEVLWFADNPCPPSVLGLNYYVTSDRFLDHRFALYPPSYAGGDTGFEPLIDVEALRVRAEGIVGVGAILTEAWQRYHLPVAITEAHLGGTCHDQILWLAEVWQQAQAARQAGADVRAVTVWALLGSWNWSNLCTRDSGIYEPGVFTLVDGQPTPTELTAFVKNLVRDPTLSFLGQRDPGWWQQASRLTFPPYVPGGA